MSTIRNVRFSISGEGFSPTEGEYFAGTLEPGSQASHEFELIPNQAGYLTGTVTYTYEDTQGQTRTETQDFSFDVTDSAEVINPGGEGGMDTVDTGMVDPGAEEQDFFSQYQWYIVGGAVILAVIVVVIIVAAVRRRKKNEDEDY